jgi:hypothetical protein
MVPSWWANALRRADAIQWILLCAVLLVAAVVAIVLAASRGGHSPTRGHSTGRPTVSTRTQGTPDDPIRQRTAEDAGRRAQAATAAAEAARRRVAREARQELCRRLGLVDRNQYILRTESGEKVPVAISEAVLDRLMDFAAAGDTVGVDRLLHSFQVLALEQDTRVRVINRGFLRSEARVETGLFAGTLIWLPSDFLWRP